MRHFSNEPSGVRTEADDQSERWEKCDVEGRDVLQEMENLQKTADLFATQDPRVSLYRAGGMPT